MTSVQLQYRHRVDELTFVPHLGCPLLHEAGGLHHVYDRHDDSEEGDELFSALGAAVDAHVVSAGSLAFVDKIHEEFRSSVEVRSRISIPSHQFAPRVVISWHNRDRSRSSCKLIRNVPAQKCAEGTRNVGYPTLNSSIAPQWNSSRQQLCPIGVAA